MAEIVVEMWAEILGDVEHGSWCAWCFLPSAVIYTLAVGISDTVFKVCRHMTCYECLQTFHLENIDPEQFQGSPVELSAKERCG